MQEREGGNGIPDSGIPRNARDGRSSSDGMRTDLTAATLEHDLPDPVPVPSYQRWAFPR